jgi:hypothetical protein
MMMILDKLPPQLRSRKRLLVAAVVAVAVVLVVVVVTLLAHHESGTGSNKPTKESPENSQQTEEELRDYKHELTVTISADGVSPQTLNAPKDTRIIWMNTDTVPHKIAVTPGTPLPPQFDNNHQVDPAGGYPFVVHQPVSFHYYIVDRPTQGGEVFVK